MGLDRRLYAYRPDLADIRLQGRVEAQRFVEGRPARVSAALCPFHDAPDLRSQMVAEKLMGEPLRVFEEAEGWFWAQSAEDGYVGYAPRERVVLGDEPANLRVTALRTHLYPEPDLKAPPLGWAPLGARLSAARGEAASRFRPVAGGGWVYGAHVAEGEASEPPGWAADWVAVAEAFRQTPYLWGGESADGIDCSGLIHVALQACGRAAPRDSDMQEAELGEPLAAEARPGRGDLVFWRGHVGVMLDSARLLHANAWSMSAIVEPLAQTRARIAAQGGGEVTARRRLGTVGED